MAIFNGILEVVIYMDQSEGFVQKGKKPCVQIQEMFLWAHAITRACYRCIHLISINEGFYRNQRDYSLYVTQTNEYSVITIFYVNILIILASNVTQLKWLKSKLKKDF
jgi:hypothetical protein